MERCIGCFKYVSCGWDWAYPNLTAGQVLSDTLLTQLYLRTTRALGTGDSTVRTFWMRAQSSERLSIFSEVTQRGHVAAEAPAEACWSPDPRVFHIHL